MTLQEISNIVFDIKDHLTDLQYKTIMDNLADVYKQEDDYSVQFFRQYFYHSSKSNKFFNYIYRKNNNSITTVFDYNIQNWSVGDMFVYEKSTDGFETIATIIKIMPKYCILDVNHYFKKVSNFTLAKVVNFPYIIV